MRLFVALELSEEIRGGLQQLLARLERVRADVRWVRAEGMHLTLKFVGEVPPEKLPPIEQALGAVNSAAPVQVRFRGLGFFPGPRRPRVVWVGVEASDNMAPLAAQVEAELEPLGIAREKRAYVPHLTLGRFKSDARLPRLQEEIAALGEVELGGLEAKSFTLFQSKLTPGGAVYTPLRQFHFVRD